jgi:hypothetical protein
MALSTVRLYLLGFAYHRLRQINDNLVEAFIHRSTSTRMRPSARPKKQRRKP